MLTQQTLQQLRQLKLIGMADSLQAQLAQPSTYDDMSFEERISLMIAHEIPYRDNKRLQRLLKTARFKMSASLNDINYRHPRGLRKEQIASLQLGEWISKKQNLLITGPTGCGKTYLACAVGHQACLQGFSVRYYRASRIFEALTIAHGDGSYLKLINQIAKADLVIFDDWGLEALTQSQRNDLLEIMEDRHNSGSTLVTSQLPTEQWHGFIQDAILADAILDRLLHNAHKMPLKGESMRKVLATLTQGEHLG